MGRTSRIKDALHSLRHGGAPVIAEGAAWAYFKYLRRTTGLNVYDRDWDVLVILDACRADLMAEAMSRYDWLTGMETVTSIGGASSEWIDKTFGGADRTELKRTAYITGNPFSREHLTPEQLGLLDEVWRYAWDDDLGTIRARPITDRTITVGRQERFDRLIVHYMQPHFPSVPHPEPDEGTSLHGVGTGFQPVWEKARFGQKTREEIWEQYRDNLYYVLDDVALLRKNIDADRMVLTADHGNAIGEHWIYGHDNGSSHPKVRTVPWCVTDATDDQGHEPDTYDRETGSDVKDAEIKERLAALGYQ